MDTPEKMNCHPTNLNTLDNRKCNLVNKAIEVEGEEETTEE